MIWSKSNSLKFKTTWLPYYTNCFGTKNQGAVKIVDYETREQEICCILAKTNCDCKYSQSCLGQETTKESFGFRIKLPPAHLPTTHGIGLTLSNAECQARKLWIPIFIVFGLIRPGIEPGSTVILADIHSIHSTNDCFDCIILFENFF